MPHPPPDGFRYLAGHFDRAQQAALVAAVRALVAAAPLYRPAMPRTGQKLSVRMTNCGPLGWVSDVTGYRYQPTHPVTGAPWPPIPLPLLELWAEVADFPHPPEACLVNWYAPDARLGLHVDADEGEKRAPVVSVSLGDSAVFRLGGTSRRDPTRSMRLVSGDVVVLGGGARLAYHGVDRILPGTSTLLREPGRINLTLRRVTVPAD
ncbi:alpha-ketoglutarate-dependent dioxygenase AlkB [Prosthecomicrobium pneumaticum]|uniref:Alkylated DNA repair protein (DNA oxidative demethylase) n=1 Tax=Prosthecomicrobium pneumaticum TaxID=81895 RepID=A0A7W9FNP6_9HYPH|nr:alpha-ketoglutarate-dependent dioxygenase AlkB [Prosthecomicrobium pneumaticum]MBB5754069.1 alkylated DNA repair protein (DNA oxidative demethylase) [Prosthecomicrobium pneumaticum]